MAVKPYLSPPQQFRFDLNPLPEPSAVAGMNPPTTPTSPVSAGPAKITPKSKPVHRATALERIAQAQSEIDAKQKIIDTKTQADQSKTQAAQAKLDAAQAPYYTDTDTETETEKELREQLKKAQDTFSPEKMAEMEQIAHNSPAYQEQIAGLQGQEDLLANLPPSKRQMNLSPLMAWADSVTGSKLLPGYKPPAQTDRDKMILDYYEKIQDNKRDLYKSTMEGLKAQRAGTTTDRLLQELGHKFVTGTEDKDPRYGEDKRARGGGDPNRDSWKVFNAFSRDREVQTAQKGLAELPQIYASIDANSWIGDTALPGRIAALAGERPLSNTDIYRYSTDRAVADRLIQTLEFFKTGKLTPQHRDDFRKLVDLMKVRAEDQLAKRAAHFSQNLAPQVGVGSAKAQTMMLGNTPKAAAAPPASASSVAPPPASGALNDTERKRLDELRAKKAGK